MLRPVIGGDGSMARRGPLVGSKTSRLLHTCLATGGGALDSPGGGLGTGSHRPGRFTRRATTLRGQSTGNGPALAPGGW